jgi:hypothetical protein
MNNDSFTSPDPPGGQPPNDPPDDGADIGLIPEGGSLLDMIDDDVSCENCTHYRTCALIAGFRGMTQQWEAGDEEDEAPVDATNFAVICEEFQPVEDI